MKLERLRQALAARQTLYGTWVQTPSAEVVEILGRSGWDFVILDLEHGPYGPESLPHLIRAAEAAETTSFVRVPLTAPHDVGKALDLGAAGIVTPGVTSAEAGAAAVRFTRFPPRGSRGSSPSTRQLHYSAIPFASLAAPDAPQPLVVLQVEARLATSDLGSILAIDSTSCSSALMTYRHRWDCPDSSTIQKCARPSPKSSTGPARAASRSASGCPMQRPPGSGSAMVSGSSP